MPMQTMQCCHSSKMKMKIWKENQNNTWGKWGNATLTISVKSYVLCRVLSFVFGKALYSQ